VGIVSALVIITLVAVVWWALSRESPRPAPTEREPQTLKVGPGAPYKTIADAWKAAHANDRIVVQAPIEDDLVLDGSDENHKNITIEPEDRKAPLLWKPRPKGKHLGHLLALKGVEGLQLRGFKFDGLNQFSAGVILVTGRCPGSVLESIEVEGFTSTGVLLMNCEGDEGRPVTLSGLTVRPSAAPGAAPAASALTFNFDPATISVPANRHIRLSSCRLEGAYQQGAIRNLKPDKTTQVELVNVTAAGQPIRSL
jgi:hypothetical protein